MASLFLSARILARADPVYRQPRALWLAAGALFMILCFLPDQFGQREQFALIGILPWLALQCARQRMPNFAAGSPVERIVAGLGAGVVVMVKPPHFALALMVPSLCLALQRRSLKPFFVTENLLGAAIAIAYVTSIAMFDRAYFDEILPFVREIYLPLRVSLVDNMANWPKIVLLLAVATVIAAGGMRALHWDMKILLASALGFVPAFLIMGKGWPNHALPMVVVSTIAFGVLLLRFGGFQSAASIRKAALVFGCALVLQVTIRAQYAALTTDSEPIVRAAAVIRGTIENPTIVSIAGQMQVAHPLTRLVGGSFIARQSSAWAVSNADVLARDAGNPGQREKLEGIRDQLIGEHAIEIASKKPDVVLSGPEADPSWNTLMLQDKRIAAALSDYRVLYTEPLITVYLRCTVGSHDCQVGRQASGSNQ
ncbi:hypothetical protein [Mesorhizobium caraganae]|uniref:hypothetical protein n=1 Tax=Mesorhizobium caraganae TaxID=483206 RepID=UPI0019394506|nr:hypothetical protein [Mesorhizobium caraganae]